MPQCRVFGKFDEPDRKPHQCDKGGGREREEAKALGERGENDPTMVRCASRDRQNKPRGILSTRSGGDAALVVRQSAGNECGVVM